MQQVTIIAEAGVNHNGDLDTARKLIDVAAGAGADYVKFQTFKTELLVSPDAPKAMYQEKNLNDQSSSQFSMLKRLELSDADHHALYDYALSKGIKFLSTAFDLPSIDFLASLGIDTFKIPSGELTNYPYLIKIARMGKPVILSTGMAEMSEIRNAAQVLFDNGLTKEDLIVLHCNSEYPTPFNDVNLRAMANIGDDLNVRFGYSDHTLGIEVPIAAVALGASLIEKHFTLSRDLPGPDHKASLEPDELCHMVSAIRNIELALSGDGIKKPTPSELKNRAVGRKSIFAIRDLSPGSIISEADLIMKRPGDGLSPMQLPELIGLKVKNQIRAGAKISLSDLD